MIEPSGSHTPSTSPDAADAASTVVENTIGPGVALASGTHPDAGSVLPQQPGEAAPQTSNWLAAVSNANSAP